VAGDSPARLGGLLTGLAPGSRIAGYLLERLVGVGGVAAVFRARDERLGRVVALKLLTGDDVVHRRFTREAHAVAAVDHPHIIPVYEAGEAEGVLFIAMRFVAGDDLRVVAGRDGALRPHRAAAFISPVASALDAAHDAGLVHRDVKPANMLVDVGPHRPEHVYLTDFGLARGVMSMGELTGAGQFLGTPDYAAPEQINGRPVDGRADQYALGCVAWTLLGGRVPFVREEPMAVLYAHLSEPPPRLTAVRPDLPGAVDEVLARALAKSPEDRFPSCGDFADALRDALGLDPYDPARPAHVQVAGSDYQRTITAQPGRAPALGTATAKLTIPPDAVAVPPEVPTAETTVRPQTWIAVVAADRAYYDSLHVDPSISFPDGLAERRFPLSGTQVRIGRRSVSGKIEPEIDLTGPPRDPGVSRLQAVLSASPDDSWSITDPGSPNGILVNGKEAPPGEAVPLRDGDRIHLGAWTVITIVGES
jgi:serine/threonine protein kinase